MDAQDATRTAAERFGTVAIRTTRGTENREFRLSGADVAFPRQARPPSGALAIDTSRLSPACEEKI